MPIVSRDTQLVALQAGSVATFYTLATLTASSYTQLVAANAERRQGVWLHNNNIVSTTSSFYAYTSASPSSDSDALLVRPLAATVAPGVVFIPGTGAVFCKSVNSGVLATAVGVEH
jgi:hypothetical protein